MWLRSFVVVCLAIYLITSVSCSKNMAVSTNTDDTYREKLLGTWIQKDTSSELALERTFYFYPDGTYRTSAKLTGQQYNKTHEYENNGVWTIENGIMYITLLNSTHPSVPLGIKTPNKIISITKTQIVTESTEGIRTSAYRFTSN